MRKLIIYLFMLLSAFSYSQIITRGGKDLLIELCAFPESVIDGECEVYNNSYMDFPASFPEGKSSLQAHVVKRSKEYNPENLKKYNNKFLHINVIIEKNGLISNILVLNNNNADIEKMLLEIFNTLPPWNPGRQNDLIVCSSYTFSLKIYDEK